MRRSIAQLSLSLVLALAGMHTGVCQQGSGISQTKLILCDGLPCIEAQLNGGRVVRLALDIGEPTAVLDSGVAKELGLAIEPVLDKDGKPYASLQSTKVDEVSSGTLKLGQVEFLVTSLAGALKVGLMPHVDGTLAYGAFKDQVVQMDFAQNRLTVSRPGTRTCHAGTMSLITFGSY